MKVKPLIEKLLENWLVKVICFVMALIFYAFYRFTTLEKRTFTVPVTVHAQNGIVAAGAHVSEVRVTARARPDDIVALRETDFSAYLDLDYVAAAGTYDFPVFVRLSENAMGIDPLEIQLSPEHISLAVEEQITGFVPVSPLVSGTPAHGYEVKSVTAAPPEVQLTGARTMIENYRRLQTKPVSVDGLTASATFTAELENVSSFVRHDAGETVAVTVEVVPVVIERTYEKLPVALVNVGAALEAGYTETLSLTLRGNQTALERYTPAANALTANCAGVTGGGVSEVPLTVRVPGQFKVIGELPKTVSVSFREKVQPQQAEAEE